MYKKEIWVVALIIFGCKVTKVERNDKKYFIIPEME